MNFFNLRTSMYKRAEEELGSRERWVEALPFAVIEYNQKPLKGFGDVRISPFEVHSFFFFLWYLHSFSQSAALLFVVNLDKRCVLKLVLGMLSGNWCVAADTFIISCAYCDANLHNFKSLLYRRNFAGRLLSRFLLRFWFTSHYVISVVWRDCQA